jgi:hypothetical protein
LCVIEPTPRGKTGGRPLDRNGDQIVEIDAVALCYPVDRNTCTIRYGVATEAWRKLVATDGSHPYTSGNRLGSFAFTEAYEDGDSIGLTISHAVMKGQVRIVAIDSAEKTHIPTFWSAGRGATFRQATSKFHGLRRQDIVEFQLQVRDYQWVEFQNVSLEPDVRTKVAVVVADEEAR